jgi:hypothetical protein
MHLNINQPVIRLEPQFEYIMAWLLSYLPLGSRACFVSGLHIRLDGFTPSSAGP